MLSDYRWGWPTVIVCVAAAEIIVVMVIAGALAWRAVGW